MRNVLWLLAYSFVCGLCLALFTQIAGVLKYAFSLAAFFVGLRFFRQFETIGMRISFVLVAIAMFLLILIVYVMIAAANGKLDMVPHT